MVDLGYDKNWVRIYKKRRFKKLSNNLLCKSSCANLIILNEEIEMYELNLKIKKSAFPFSLLFFRQNFVQKSMLFDNNRSHASLALYPILSYLKKLRNKDVRINKHRVTP